jgi:thiamine-phosphate pyrophosphorylase
VIDFRLCLITEGQDTQRLREALQGGLRAVQLRAKGLNARELLRRAKALRELTASYGARLLVNDRADVALAAGADGVHLPSNGLPVEAVRRLAGRRLLVGASVHSLLEAQEAARQGADFLLFGPVFPTPAKRTLLAQPQGLVRLAHVAPRVPVPLLAVGGINRENVHQVLQAGAYGVALIRGILEAGDIREETRKLQRILQ